MALHERSAGIILFTTRAAPKQARQFLLLDYGRYWDYPKGHVEKGEDDRTAALRELKEETGIAKVDLIEGFNHEITYFFRSKHGLVRKRVIFFLASTPSERVKLSHEHVGHEWLPFDKAVERLNYATAKAALRAAGEYLQNNPIAD
jgi:8-oxo-dGTP pyrophosphatase MutT (NUDIX family)